mgnify:CR=1 FL=1
MHELSRRRFLETSLASGVIAGLPSGAGAATPAPAGLPDLGAGSVPIGIEERQARIANVQRLMRASGVGALLVEAGSSLVYFTGIGWWRSERPTAALIPVEGEIAIVTPFFEAPSIRESLAVPAEVRTWNEDENPLRLVAEWLKQNKLERRPVAIEETVRNFIVDGLQRALPGVKTVSGAPVVRGCRMHKSLAEIQLMQIASDITVAAFRHAAPRIERGMSPQDIGRIIQSATTALGGESEPPLVLLGEASAYPHGSGKPQQVRDGEVVLIDGGCSVHGYTSDISRTFVFGEPSKAQREVWMHVHRGQEIALDAARIGAPAGSVDDKVRAWYTSLGYGPGYRLPGLSHRTGHGIGMDGHEPVNLVHGETMPLAAGMCFSNEPGIYIPGSFGIRLEDCFYMTPDGPRWFSVPPPSIDRPFG